MLPISEPAWSQVIHTQRLMLRVVDEKILPMVFTLLSEPEQRSYLGAQTDEAYAREKLRYEKGCTTFNKSFVSFYIVKKESGEVIGWQGYHTWYLEHRRAEIGYLLFADEHKNKGYLSEVMPVMLDYGFNKMNLHRVEAFVEPKNRTSLRLMEKFGFTREGHLRQHYIKDGVIEDSLVFSLLQPEYNKP